MKRRSMLILAGVCMAALVLAPSLALAGDTVFTYDKGPNFTVTYPDSWAPDSANPQNADLRVKDPSGIPVMETKVQDIPAGVAVADVCTKVYKPALEKHYEMEAKVTKNEQITLGCGTPAYELRMEWLYQGWLPLETQCVCTYKDNKYVYVSASGDPGALTNVPLSLKFK